MAGSMYRIAALLCMVFGNVEQVWKIVTSLYSTVYNRRRYGWFRIAAHDSFEDPFSILYASRLRWLPERVKRRLIFNKWRLLSWVQNFSPQCTVSTKDNPRCSTNRSSSRVRALIATNRVRLNQSKWRTSADHWGGGDLIHPKALDFSKLSDFWIWSVVALPW